MQEEEKKKESSVSGWRTLEELLRRRHTRTFLVASSPPFLTGKKNFPKVTPFNTRRKVQEVRDSTLIQSPWRAAKFDMAHVVGSIHAAMLCVFF